MQQIRVTLKSTESPGWEREILAEPKEAEGPFGPEPHYRVRVWGWPGAFLCSPLLDILLPAFMVEHTLEEMGVGLDNLKPGASATVTARVCSTLPFTEDSP